ncbi:MAG: hypothetical protein WA973_20195 [Mesorhizobium sp.]
MILAKQRHAVFGRRIDNTPPCSSIEPEAARGGRWIGGKEPVQLQLVVLLIRRLVVGFFRFFGLPVVAFPSPVEGELVPWWVAQRRCQSG